jgi:hypothetical protein
VKRPDQLYPGSAAVAVDAIDEVQPDLDEREDPARR